MAASAELQASQADLQKALNDLFVEVDTAHRRMIQSRRLVEAYQGGVLDDVRALLEKTIKAFSEKKTTVFEVLDVARTASDLAENYLEALFSYQRDVLLLENAVGQDLH